MGIEKELVLTTSDSKLSVLKTLVENRVTELNPESLVSGTTDAERQKLKEAVLLMGVLTDLSKAMETSRQKEVLSFGMTSHNCYCLRCQKETGTEYTDQVAFCSICQNAK